MSFVLIIFCFTYLFKSVDDLRVILEKWPAVENNTKEGLISSEIRSAFSRTKSDGSRFWMSVDMGIVYKFGRNYTSGYF